MVDAISKAQDIQWELSMIDDPVEASIMAAEALGALSSLEDARIQEGKGLIVSALGAYMLRQWDEDENRYINMEYKHIVAMGTTLGRMAFVQNIVSNPYLQTIVLPIKDASIFPKPGSVDLDEVGVDTAAPINSVRIPSLIIPILEVEEVKLAA